MELEDRYRKMGATNSPMTTQPHGSGFTSYEQKRWGSDAPKAGVNVQTERYAQAISPGLVRDAPTIGAASASAGVSRSGDGLGFCERDDNSYGQSDVYSSTRNEWNSAPAFRAHEDATFGTIGQSTSATLPDARSSTQSEPLALAEAMQALVQAQIKMTDALTDFSRKDVGGRGYRALKPKKELTTITGVTPSHLLKELMQFKMDLEEIGVRQASEAAYRQLKAQCVGRAKDTIGYILVQGEGLRLVNKLEALSNSTSSCLLYTSDAADE